MAVTERYLVTTDFGDVVVAILRPGDGSPAGLDADLVSLAPATPETVAGLTMATPLRAFGAKMLELIEAQATTAGGMSQTLVQMLVKERTTEELKRIERFAKGVGR